MLRWRQQLSKGGSEELRRKGKKEEKKEVRKLEEGERNEETI